MAVGDSDDDERAEELSSITAIFPELRTHPDRRYAASLTLPIKLATPLLVKFQDAHRSAVIAADADEEQGVQPSNDNSYSLMFLPPLDLQIELPDGYPESKPPATRLSANTAWLPFDALNRYANHVVALWEEYGGGQIVFSYIDYLQQEADSGFGLRDPDGGPTVVPAALKTELLRFDRQAKKEEFDCGTYDCGICLEPKKGSFCHQMFRCGHVFCAPCLQDVYNNAITEGDVAAIRCLDPDCGSMKDPKTKRVRKSTKTLGPGELLEISIEQPMVQRYVNLKRKKKLESDKTTIYCPRQWCQGPARSKKYPKSTDLSQMDSYASDDEENPKDTSTEPPRSDKQINEGRLAICEDCEYAFCRTCLAGWHGEFVRCWPRTTTELSAEEKESYNWIRMNTSPCPTCSTPTQKTMGCNHMQCMQCRTHFCYLCSAWLEPTDPYKHFNRPGFGCYQRLWELEEGDDGQNQGLAFGGPRGWEAEIEAQDEAEAAAVAAAGEAEVANAALIAGAIGGVDRPAAQVNQQLPGMEGLQINDQRHVNPGREFIAAGNAPNRLRVVRQQPPGLRALRQEPNNEGLQRFLQMAVADNEDEWDSDEMDDGGDDADWVIPER